MGKMLPLKTEVPKIEFGQAYTRCVEIAESYEPENLKILMPFTHAKNSVALAAELMVKARQPLTAAQSASIMRLQKNAASLLKHVRSLQNEPSQAHATDIAYVFYFVERHLAGLRKSNSYRQVRLIEGMMDDLAVNETVRQAVEALGFDTFFALLQAELTRFNAIYKERRKTLSEREKARSQKIKRKLYFLLRQLFTAIELAEIQHPELDYSPLISELNQEILRCKFSVKQRKGTPAVEPGDAAIEAPIENEAV